MRARFTGLARHTARDARGGPGTPSSTLEGRFGYARREAFAPYSAEDPPVRLDLAQLRVARRWARRLARHELARE